MRIRTGYDARMSTPLADSDLRWAVGIILVEARGVHRAQAVALDQLQDLANRLALQSQRGETHEPGDVDELCEAQGAIVETRRQFRTLVAQLYATIGSEVLTG